MSTDRQIEESIRVNFPSKKQYLEYKDWRKNCIESFRRLLRPAERVIYYLSVYLGWGKETINRRTNKAVTVRDVERFYKERPYIKEMAQHIQREIAESQSIKETVGYNDTHNYGLENLDGRED